VLEQRGCVAGFTNNCGHHVGFPSHDRGPVHQPGSRFPLQAGMIVTVGPGVYRPKYGGARFDDDVLVGPGGAEILSAKG